MEIHGVWGRLPVPFGGARATGGALHGGGAAQEEIIREFEGSWTVSEEPGGGVAFGTLALRPALTPPYAHKIFLRQIREILQDVQDEVERWEGRPYPGAAGAETDQTAVPVAR